MESNFACVFVKLISWIDILSTSPEIGPGWVPQNPTDDKSTLVQVVAWCLEVTSCYNHEMYLENIL